MLSLCVGAVAKDKEKSAPSSKDQQMAAAEFKRAIDLQTNGKIEEALLAATHASQIEPGNMEYLMAKQVLMQQILGKFLDEGNRLAAAGDSAGAMANFREALARDPQNSYAQQRLRDVMPPEDPQKKHVMELLASVEDINLTPREGKRNVRLGPDTRGAYNAIGQAFGITFNFDQSVSSRPLNMNLDNVDFYETVGFLGRITKTFWSPVSAREAIVANDNQEMRTAYERLSVRTFYVGNISATTDLNDLANVMRTIFEMRFISLQANRNTITVRAPRTQIAAVTSMLESLMEAKPEILIEVQEFEYDTDKAATYGMELPSSFTIFNVPSEIRRVLGANAQPVIDQLNKTGTIDPSKIDPSTLQNLAGSPLLAPFVFFGKGLGLTGITVSPIKIHLSATNSTASTIERATLRATDGEAVTFRLGDKFPIVNGNFTTVAFNTRGQVQAGNTPQFQFVDLGLTLKTTPHYHSDGSIKLDLDFELLGLGTAQVNNIPDLTTRGFKGNITVADGESSVVMGAVTDQELRTTSGYPGIGQLPGFSSVLSTNTKDRAHNEIVLIITPHVIRKPFHDKGSSIFWTLN
jgi:type II secretory pathway component GspD/PulD (secretin)